MGLVIRASVIACLLVGLAPGSRATAQSRPLPTRTIDISMHQADIRDVLRLFGEVGDVNIVYGDEVDGQVTLRLRRVPWADALRAILRTKGLGMVWDGTILRVASHETLERERAARIAARRTCEETAPLRTRIVRLSYARAADAAEHVRASIGPRGSVEIDERTNSLIIRDVDCD